MRSTPLFALALLSTAALTACTVSGSAPTPTQDSERISEVAARSGLQAGLGTKPAGEGARGAQAMAVQPLASKKFGADITETASTPLPALMKEPGKFSAKTV